MPNPTSHRTLDRARWGRWLVLGIICGTVSFGQELVLHLRNGDRLSGRLLSETTNEVVIATSFAERLSVPLNLIERRDLPAPVAVTNAPPPKPAGMPPARPATGLASELVLTNKPSLAQTAGGAIKPPEPKPKPPPSLFESFFSELNGEAQLGGNFGFGTKDREAFTGHIKVTHNHVFPNKRPMRNIVDYDIAYGTTDEILSDNSMEGTWKTEYDVTKRFLVYSALGGGYDELRNIDFQYDVGPGVGYKWILTTNFVFKTELGGNYQEEFFVGDDVARRYSFRLAEDSWWQITPKLRWDQKVEYFPEVNDFTAKFRIRAESNLSYLLKQNLTLTLNVVDLYDTAVPDGITNNDLQIRSLIGLKF